MRWTATYSRIAIRQLIQQIKVQHTHVSPMKEIAKNKPMQENKYILNLQHAIS